MKHWSKLPNQFRIRYGVFGSDQEKDGCNGAFNIPVKNIEGRYFTVIISDGMKWDHVSVSLQSRTPTWEEMCVIKDLFFKENETVLQFHPPKKDYINNHQYSLHMWRPHKQKINLPKTIMV
jgi:hypothetical protein